MGRSRVGGPRVLAALAVAAAANCGVFAASAGAASRGAANPGTTGSSSTTALPLLPSVGPEYTDYLPAQTLLANAEALASLGQDNAALVRAVAGTQVKLDADAVIFQKAKAALALADGREAQARDRLQQAEHDYANLQGDIRQAVIYLYTNGLGDLTVTSTAGTAALYAQAYADSTIGPYGVLARRQAIEQERAEAVQQVDGETRAAGKASAEAAKALTNQRLELSRLNAELASAGSASITAAAADQSTLAGQAGKELLSDTALQFTPKTPLPAPLSTTSVALTWAFAELGKEYVWGATGPDTFDCSGLTQFVWKAAGVEIPRVAADQDAWTVPVPLSQLLPGDLVFFGTNDIHHVGIYIGHGLMINAPHTGTVIQVSSIWWSDLAGFGRVHYPGIPVPPHETPTNKKPSPPVVIPSAGPVPSETTPPLGRMTLPGSGTPDAKSPGTITSHPQGSTVSSAPIATSTTSTAVSSLPAPSDTSNPSTSTRSSAPAPETPATLSGTSETAISVPTGS